MRQVQNKIKAVIQEDVITAELIKRNWTYDKLLDQLTEKYGLDIGYKAFAKMLKNKSSWFLTYAFVMCDFLGLTLVELFVLVKNETTGE